LSPASAAVHQIAGRGSHGGWIAGHDRLLATASFVTALVALAFAGVAVATTRLSVRLSGRWVIGALLVSLLLTHPLQILVSQFAAYWFVPAEAALLIAAITSQGRLPSAPGPQPAKQSVRAQ
jgi:hypothetical protein